MSINLPDPLMWSLAVAIVCAGLLLLLLGIRGVILAWKPPVTPEAILKLETRVDNADARSDATLHVLSQAMWIIAQDGTQTAVPGEHVALTPGQISEHMLAIIRMPAHLRTEDHYWLFRDHWSAEWCKGLMEQGVTEDELGAFARGTENYATPDDVAQAIRQALAAVILQGQDVPDFPRGMFDTTGVMDALRAQPLVGTQT